MRKLLTLLAAAACAGCVPTSPSFLLHGDDLAAVRAAGAGQERCERVHLDIPLALGDVWPASLLVLSQYTIVSSSRRGDAEAHATFLVVDAVPSGKKPGFMVDMPFTLEARQGDSGVTALDVCPLAGLLDPHYRPEQATAIKGEMQRQAIWLLNRVMIQSTAQKKWQWLRKGGSGHEPQPR